MNKNKFKKIVLVLFFIIIIFAGLYIKTEQENKQENILTSNQISYEISNIPEYSGEIYIEINNNIPEFTTEDISLDYDYYSDLENGKVRNGNDKNKLEKSKRR